MVDAADLLRNPRGVLTELCRRLGLEFRESMLAWPAGPRPTDGVWAKHWYEQVERSTGFAPYRPREGELSADLVAVEAEACEIYQRLHAFRITAVAP